MTITPSIAAAAVATAKQALDHIAQQCDAIEAYAAFDEVGVALVRHMEAVDAEAALMRAAIESRIRDRR